MHAGVHGRALASRPPLISPASLRSQHPPSLPTRLVRVGEIGVVTLTVSMVEGQLQIVVRICKQGWRHGWNDVGGRQSIRATPQSGGCRAEQSAMQPGSCHVEAARPIQRIHLSTHPPTLQDRMRSSAGKKPSLLPAVGLLSLLLEEAQSSASRFLIGLACTPRVPCAIQACDPKRSPCSGPPVPPAATQLEHGWDPKWHRPIQRGAREVMCKQPRVLAVAAVTRGTRWAGRGGVGRGRTWVGGQGHDMRRLQMIYIQCVANISSASCGSCAHCALWSALCALRQRAEPSPRRVSGQAQGQGANTLYTDRDSQISNGDRIRIQCLL